MDRGGIFGLVDGSEISNEDLPDIRGGENNVHFGVAFCSTGDGSGSAGGDAGEKSVGFAFNCIDAMLVVTFSIGGVIDCGDGVGKYDSNPRNEGGVDN